MDFEDFTEIQRFEKILVDCMGIPRDLNLGLVRFNAWRIPRAFITSQLSAKAEMATMKSETLLKDDY